MNRYRAHGQRGVSLVIILILLLIMTLLGLISLRATMMDERLSSNIYDRSLSFQAAERALREGETLVASGAANLGQDCQDPTVVCPMPSAIDGTIPGCPTCWTNATAPLIGDLAPGRPQFYIQRMREITTSDQLGQGNNAAGLNEGASGNSVTEASYRVFSRSHDPALAPDRAVVQLESNLVRK